MLQLLLVEFITPSNASVFMDYIVPNIRPLATDSDPIVRTAYSWCLAPLADCGQRFISMLGLLQGSENFASERDELEETALDVSLNSSLLDLLALTKLARDTGEL